MRARFAASALAVALLAFGTAGCAFITPQATTMEVETSDGVSGTIGTIAVRNATLISEDGALANLLVSFTNQGDSAALVTVQYEDGETGEAVSQQISVPSRGITSFGGDGAEQILLSNVSKPGSLFPVYFQQGTVEGKQLLVPVLTTSLPEYTGLAPTPTPTPTPTVTTAPLVETPVSPEPTEAPGE